MSLTVIKGDITNIKVHAIVNAANNELKMGAGVCGAIFKKAGINDMKNACDKLSPIKTGEAVITPGFNLKANYVIHAVGPIYKNYTENESKRLLENAYRNSLIIAKENKLKSIAFPIISSGIYGYPKDEAFEVAKKTIEEFIIENEIDVYLVVFDES